MELVMNIYYVNDEYEPVIVRVQHHFVFDPNNPLAEPKHEYITLQPQESRLFQYSAPEGSIPYVKRWENRIVLLSYLTPEALEHIQTVGDKKTNDSPQDT